MKKNMSTDFSTRQYMYSTDFEIYYYDDKDLSQVKIHSHNYFEFYFFLNGNVSMWIDGKSYSLKPGDMILIPPAIPHKANIISSDAPYQRFILWISESYCNDLRHISDNYHYLFDLVMKSHHYVYHFDIIEFNTLQYKIFQLLEELHFDRFGKDEKISLSVRDLIFHLNRIIYEQKHPSVPKEKQTLYQNLLNYIEDHIEDDLSLDHLADIFFVSKYHISHIFKNSLGISLHQYILKKRLAMSRDAILSNMKMDEIYLLCGFKDYSNFYRSFKKEYGVSPSQYKENYLQTLKSPDSSKKTPPT